ncbi:3-methyl-2-oxobutanoate hydroxymethyltransferase [Deinococcus irradiatisoli]|uniref:3-methyl-2-oxobutanoate hydroxymethyltransferase n=1 Tax=Deinococcus irradiatisoli TaxID=2202254 RepID=A0A2Z3JHW1_9DEIO|nr:3-methyl-2-oxobutanoate hydroxymethyltransferase [Deinococcus irradiatisoli]
MKLTLPELRRDTPLVMVTAYDYPSAQQAERAGMDLILVGDSLGNVVLGYDSTAPVTLSDVIHHTRAVRRGAPETFLIADLPFGTYHTGLHDAMRAAIKILQETGADAVKLEGASPEVLEVIRVLTRNGIPVMAHVGLTPQTEVSLGGRKVQGRDEVGAQRIVQAALDVEAAGAFAVVLEVIPARLARLITEKLDIPTIGIGAGPYCDGQVLVYHDVLGVYDGEKKIAKRYAELGRLATQALSEYADEVRTKAFPTRENSFIIKDEVLDKLY